MPPHLFFKLTDHSDLDQLSIHDNRQRTLVIATHKSFRDNPNDFLKKLKETLLSVGGNVTPYVIDISGKDTTLTFLDKEVMKNAGIKDVLDDIKASVQRESLLT